jgi:nitrogen regulatory protein PII
MSTQATKLVIITAMLLFKHVVRILEAAGATGYTLTAAESKGSRNTRSPGHPSVSDTYEKIKVEVITVDDAVARKIADEIAANYIENFSGIIFITKVEVLYAHSLSSMRDRPSKSVSGTRMQRNFRSSSASENEDIPGAGIAFSWATQARHVSDPEGLQCIDNRRGSSSARSGKRQQRPPKTRRMFFPLMFPHGPISLPASRVDPCRS